MLQVPDQEVARQHRQTNAEMLRCSSNREASFRGSRNLASKVIQTNTNCNACMLSPHSPAPENASKVSADAVSASLVSPDPLNSKRRLRITAQFYSRNVRKTSDGHQTNVLCSVRQWPDSRYRRSAPPSATVFAFVPMYQKPPSSSFGGNKLYTPNIAQRAGGKFGLLYTTCVAAKL